MWQPLNPSVSLLSLYTVQLSEVFLVQFSYIQCNRSKVFLLTVANPKRQEAIFHCDFHLHSLVVSDVECFFLYPWSFACCLLRNVSSGPLPIFKLSYLFSCY